MRAAFNLLAAVIRLPPRNGPDTSCRDQTVNSTSSALDDVLAILFRLNEQGITVIMIEHIMRAVMQFSERIAVLDAGEITAEGAPQEIVNDLKVEKTYLGE